MRFRKFVDRQSWSHSGEPPCPLDCGGWHQDGRRQDLGFAGLVGAMEDARVEGRSPQAGSVLRCRLWGTTDAEQLAGATGENPYAVCPEHRWYSQAMAPPMAADALSQPRFTIDDLLSEVTWSAGIDVGLVETVGGVCSPIAHNGYCEDFVRGLAPDEVLLVADAGLGTINAIKLSMHCVDTTRTRVFLNRFDETHRLHVLNAEWLRQYEALKVLTKIDDLL